MDNLRFCDLKDKQIIDVYHSLSRKRFEKRKAIVEIEKTPYSHKVIYITFLRRDGKPCSGNLFSTWFPLYLYLKRDLETYKSDKMLYCDGTPMLCLNKPENVTIVEKATITTILQKG